MTEMRQIVLERPGALVAKRVVRPEASLGEVLVRVRKIGICGTDIHAFQGDQPFFKYPRVLGHELGVEVVSSSNGSGLRPGDRCSVEPYISCGECRACRLGRTNCCESLRLFGVHVDGGMQSYLSVPARLLHKSDKLSFEDLAFIEPLSIGSHAVQRSSLKEGETALVVGCGPIGLAVAQFARAAKATVRLLELSVSRRALAAGMGLEAFESFDGERADVVFDATGSAKSMESSFDYVAQGGRLVFVGLIQGRIAFDDPEFHRREITLLASRNSHSSFPSIIQAVEDGRIDLKAWITDRVQLVDLPQEFPDLLSRPHLMKAVVDVGDDGA